MAVTASVQRDRSRRYLTAALSEQVLGAEKRWDEAREDEVLALVKLLDKEPAAAVARLRRTGHGCRWLLGRWSGLAERLASPGGWRPADCLEAIRLQGQYADPGRLDGSPEGSSTRHAFEDAFPDAVLAGYAGGPIDLRAVVKSPGWNRPQGAGPDPEEEARKAGARAWLSETVARHLGELAAKEEEVRDDVRRADAGAGQGAGAAAGGPGGVELAAVRADARAGVPPGLRRVRQGARGGRGRRRGGGRKPRRAERSERGRSGGASARDDRGLRHAARVERWAPGAPAVRWGRRRSRWRGRVAPGEARASGPAGVRAGPGRDGAAPGVGGGAGDASGQVGGGGGGPPSCGA